ncbi:MAG: cellulase family glycosylhydrolase [Deltaproteobacteria bacterium]|nr:cellulase family glycosylhydrolase [Deltaproteobacteria bacterium]
MLQVAPRLLGVAAALPALALSACGGDDSDGAAAPAALPGWHVQGGWLRAPDGRAAILRGVNVASAHKSAPYFGFHGPEDFARVRADWGMNALRLLILWAAIEPEPGAWDLGYLAQVRKRLDWAEQAGLRVVLDMHQDLYGEGFGGDGAPRWSCDEAHYAAYEPIEPWVLNYLNEHVIACFDGFWHGAELQGHYAAAWRQVALALGGHPAVVGFDIMNEPYWGSTAMGSFEQEILQPFYERIVAEVRAVAPGWIAFVEPSSSRNIGLPTGLTPLSFANAVYAPHSYDAQAEQGEGFDPARRGELVHEIALLGEEARSLGAALWVGEYGGSGDDPEIAAYMVAEYDGAAAANAGSAYWAYDRDDGYGLLTPDGSEKPALLGALVRPYPELVAGSPIRFAYDEHSRAFSLEYRADRAASAPTVIAVPERAYPDGYSVACDGCAFEKQPGQLLLTRPPAGEPATVRLAP